MSGTNSTDGTRSIGLFLPTLTPGGIERCMLNLAAGFTEINIRVDIVVADVRGDFKSEVPDEASLVDLGVDRTLKSTLPLIRYLQRRQPDVLLSGHTHANIVATWSTKLARTDTKIAVGIHNILSKNTYSDLKSQAIKRLIPITYMRADYIVAVSEAVKHDAISEFDLPADSIEVIYNPIIVDDATNYKTASVSHRWLRDASIDVVLGAGRLDERKDFTTLIQAYDRLESNQPDTRLIIAGEGEKKDHLEQTIKKKNVTKKVDLVGYKNNIYNIMSEADVFALSSKQEGFGNVLIEAMACGTPVVSTDCPGGPSEILDGGKYGPLVPVGDAEALAKHISSLLVDPTDATALRRRAMEFSVDAITEEYESVLFGSG